MDTGQMLSVSERCTEEEAAPCTYACPLKLDIRAFIKHIREEKWDSAYLLYSKQSIFPLLLSRICDEPCRNACIRAGTDSGLELKLLERAACEYALSTEVKKYKLPQKNASAVVVGAGLFGLSTALSLAAYGYRVELYEKEPRLGGRLLEIDEAVLPHHILRLELDRVIGNQSITLHLNSEIRSITECPGEVVILALGNREAETKLSKTGDISLSSVFITSTETDSPAVVIAKAKSTAQQVDWFLRGIKTERVSDSNQSRTRLKPSAEEIKFEAAVLPSGSKGYTKKEAKKEAKRCLICHCQRCTRACELLKKYRSYPKNYISNVYQNLNLIEKFSEGICKRQIYSCNICSQCQAVCPESINMGEIYLTARRVLFEKGSLPPAFHEFYLNDMEFSNGEASLILSGEKGNRYMFFPGCRLGAFLPNTVEAVYRFLNERLQGQVGMVLGCCGAPAYWAGREDIHSKTINALKDKWSSLDRPELILACPTCAKLLRRYAPEIRLMMIWELFDLIGLPEQAQRLDGREFTVFDPCNASEDRQLKQSVRTLLENRGAVLTPMKEEGGCCGYGGLISYVNPELLEQLVSRRISQSEAEYVTYCINCRDTFLRRGKPTYHLLELLFNIKEEEELPSLGKQRENRRILALHLQGNAAVAESSAPVTIDAELTEKLNKQFILPEQVCRAVLHCEKTGYVLLNEDKNTYIGEYREGAATYWVEYQRLGSKYRLVNTYKHHMELNGIP